jgi:hypothetical protein
MGNANRLFVNEKREPVQQTRQHLLLRSTISLVKTLLGLFLIPVRTATLVWPVQVTVTILIGRAISTLPCRFAIEQHIASQLAVGKTLYKLLRISGPPLHMPTAFENAS